ncbi:hypothetical protein KME66_20410 [Streptomyces sp. YPW6]|uniref:hypothetical protein n=1 Tax=Streptomyces sp. YPW6 TaxID=2840373 RepID=UPI001C0DB8BA|nr:hypothetical protein [Streptomyces sp. YPW6]QWQ43076.1 hypothetical protein KME66_20410 [Streptomyces sp. YPW6]
MTRRTRPSKERRARKRAAAERTARRDSLLVLLSRIQRTAPVTPAEAALLRAHVDAELADADTARAALGRQEAQHRQQLAAAHAAIREAEQDAADLAEQLLAYRAVEAQRQAAADTYAGRLDALRQQTGETLLAGAESALHRAATAEATLGRVRALAHRMRAGSPQGAAAVYADRIQQILDTTPEPQP